MILDRASGLLLHISSLPGQYGIGDIGPDAYRFADTCSRLGQTIWQVLPVVPLGFGRSPYASPSAFAGNPLLISPELLYQNGYLAAGDLDTAPHFPADRVIYGRVIRWKRLLLEKAFLRFEQMPASEPFIQFCDANNTWLDDYASFAAVKDETRGHLPWTEWPTPIATRQPEAMRSLRIKFRRGRLKHKFCQYIFRSQWSLLQARCRERGVKIVGDLPIYVAHDSSDVWAAPHYFCLNDHGRPTVVAGVPPDFFSDAGQRWGNPLYRWEKMEEEGYSWWTERLRYAFALFDAVRLDHFRGFAAYWSVPADSLTAATGCWKQGPGPAVFSRMEAALGPLPIVAENLGVITEDVVALLEQFGYPGMAVLQFAFGSDEGNEHLPHNYRANQAVYTGTHDNNTLSGWWASPRLADHERTFARRYLRAFGDPDKDISICALRALMQSAAGWVVSPVQDVLGLPESARMNVPGTTGDNWEWRMTNDQMATLQGDIGKMLLELTNKERRRATA